MDDYLSNEEFLSSKNLFENYKRLKALKVETEKDLKKIPNTKILEKEYIELLEFEYDLLGLYVKYNSARQEDEILELKKYIIRNIQKINDLATLRNLENFTERVRILTSKSSTSTVALG
ncbi:hypothetical protein [Clostridium perfringens]|uniref:hypothetical protein n=1 Tax=Clostridium perfringens TaxID=1502 RepID=UPI002A3348E7|nr:hypothetical protein [Clostridium perfringens]MDK0719437.1 hypothetical protein [Clostridium perfringens]MDK0859176.1 hypothetical protein [Clostridium perfringens]MDM0591280.1 hypothetical protein [Clostridium perfringens]